MLFVDRLPLVMRFPWFRLRMYEPAKKPSIFQQAGDNNALFDAIAAGNKSLSELSEKKTAQFKIKTDGGTISQMLTLNSH